MGSVLTSRFRNVRHALPRCVSVAMAGGLLATALTAQAATGWNEALQGDLSGDGLAPTPITLASGSNLVEGTVGNPGGLGIDRDYFRVVVPAGAQLSAVLLRDGSFVSGGSAFFAVQVGPQVTTTPDGSGIEALAAYDHYDNGDVGANLLSVIGLGGPLSGGTYSFWIQETGGVVPYSLDFVLATAPVPEPEGWALLAAGLGVLGLLRRRQRA